MLRDDRMMSMLTFVVILIAVGTLVQRVDVSERFFGGGSVALELKRDEAIVRANALSSIDVLANDLGLKDGDAEKLIVTEQPKCGRVFVRDGQAQYLPAERCAGSHVFRYALSGRSYGQTGEVMVVVRLGEPTQNEVAADAQRDIPSPAPIAPRTTAQRGGDTPALLAEQPAVETNAGGTIIQAARVPRPQAPAIGGLPDTASGAGPANVGGGGSSAAGINLDGAGLAPTMSAPASSLSGTSEIAAVPAAPQPDPATPVQSAPLQAEPVQPAPTNSAPTQPAPLSTESTNSQDTSTEAEPQSGGEVPVGGTNGQALSTATLARIDPTRPPTPAPAPTLGATGEAAALSIQRDNDGLATNVPRAAPPEIGANGSGQAGLEQPAEALAAVRGLGEAVDLAPVDTTPPVVLPGPGTGSGTESRQTEPQQSATPVDRVAALPAATEPCVVPPGLILDVQPAGVTEVIIESPCHAGTVAELSYDGLRFGVALDTAGSGAVAAIGLQQASDAALRFADAKTINFNIPFIGTERMERVALAWEMPVDLGLHAFEFGSQPQSSGHVRPKYPRSYGEVRRRGGGYLLQYRPVDGVGQSLNIYTYWRRQGGRTGMVKLKLDFISRDGRKRPDTCSGGAFSEPEFKVLRSVAGKLERVRNRRLASLDCAVIAGGAGSYIGDAVDDMIVRQR